MRFVVSFVCLPIFIISMALSPLPSDLSLSATRTHIRPIILCLIYTRTHTHSHSRLQSRRTAGRRRRRPHQPQAAHPSDADTEGSESAAARNQCAAVGRLAPRALHDDEVKHRTHIRKLKLYHITGFPLTHARMHLQVLFACFGL